MLRFVFAILLVIFAGKSNPVMAIYDPLSVPNNKIGIHILFPEEVVSAAKIVNGDHGEWGYVTIPIQAGDRDRVKWQKFLDLCRENKIIPLIRVATYPEGSNWAVPNNYDLVDFANFLNDLHWPTANRYIIIFNEVNRSDEYGGYVSPESYSDILYNAINIFKEKSPDFFLLPAGLDNAAANSSNSLNWRLYLERMYLRHPDIFSKIDGWTSHSYPNPDFSARADRSGANKIDSFESDLRYIRLFTTKKLPIFITETGWSNKNLSEHQIALYYQYVFSHQWQDPNIVAITPFLLSAQDGPFSQFSFLNADGSAKEPAAVLTQNAALGAPLFSATDSAVTPSPSAPALVPNTIENSSPNSKNILQNLYHSLQSLFNFFNP